MLEEEGEEEETETIQLFLRNQAVSFDSPEGITLLRSHVKQRETWDCGIACLEMILSRDGDNPEFYSTSTLLDRIGKGIQSIWTADLVWCFYHHYNSNLTDHERHCCCLFVTKSLWPNKEWKQLDYYQQAYASDSQRVTHRVHEMQQQQESRSNVFLCPRTASLSMTAVKDLVKRKDCVAMALVDHSLLLSQQPLAPTGHYVGHYIVLTGVLPNNMLVVHNPAMDEGPTYVSLEIFERAWRAQGTDEDIVFFFTRQRSAH
jgi:hypothetical protein